MARKLFFHVFFFLFLLGCSTQKFSNQVCFQKHSIRCHGLCPWPGDAPGAVLARGVAEATCHGQVATRRVVLDCVNVELAQTEQERATGLQFRKSLAPDAGMLFVFPENGRHGFWMKDTLIPLDMIWLDSSRRIVHIEENVPPCNLEFCPSYVPGAEARYALEINAGTAKRLGLRLGEEMRFHTGR